MQKVWRKNCMYTLLCVVGILLFMTVVERVTLPETTDEMRRQSIEYGAHQQRATPPYPFVYDGCTFFVDSLITSSFESACLAHDIAYWHGGTKDERREADAKLYVDMQKAGFFGQMVARSAYIAVRLFGDSILTKSVDAHWGYGWDD